MRAGMGSRGACPAAAVARDTPEADGVARVSAEPAAAESWPLFLEFIGQLQER